MADELSKGVIIEFDFTVLDGAEMLYEITSKICETFKFDPPFKIQSECRFLLGKSYVTGLTEYFSFVKTKRNPEKAASDILKSFVGQLGERISKIEKKGAVDFVEKLLEKKIKVVVFSYAAPELVRSFFGKIAEDPNFIVHQETPFIYAGSKIDTWKRMCNEYSLRRLACYAVTGNQHGLKGALLSGVPAMAVVHEHVAFQDFGGADFVVQALDGKCAEQILNNLKV
jgi:hypothetical protein